MKTIEEYLEGIEVGETIPSISGEIVDVQPPDDHKNVQIIKIQSEQRIKVYIKDKALWVVDAQIGDKVSFVCKKSKEAVKGIILKESSGGNKYITITTGASVSLEPQKSDEASAEPSSARSAPSTAAEIKIESFTLDRLYVYQKVLEIVKEYNEDKDNTDKFPMDAVSPLATSIHSFELKGAIVRPTDKQLERKNKINGSVTETPKKKEKSPDGAPKSDLDWRSFPHPKTGELLGDASIEKIKTHLAPWYYKTTPPSDNPKLADYHRHVGACVNEMTTPAQAFEAYLNNYAQDFAPNSAKRRTDAIVKFCKGVDEDGITEGYMLDMYEPTKTEAILMFREFPKLWKKYVETEE